MAYLRHVSLFVGIPLLFLRPYTIIGLFRFKRPRYWFLGLRTRCVWRLHINRQLHDSDQIQQFQRIWRALSFLYDIGLLCFLRSRKLDEGIPRSLWYIHSDVWKPSCQVRYVLRFCINNCVRADGKVLHCPHVELRLIRLRP